MANTTKIFGKWNDVALLLIGFVLTTVVGSTITYQVQQTNQKNQHLQSLRETEKEESQKVFENISDLMDKRIYKMRMIIWGYTGHIPIDSMTMENRWEDYRMVLEDWNEHINKNLALIKRYFGDSDRNFFGTNIHMRLRAAGKQLEDYKKSKDPLVMQNAIHVVDSVNYDIYAYDLKLLNEINLKNSINLAK